MKDFIVPAIPGFFTLIGVELWLERRRGVRYYRLSDAVASMSTGVIEQLIGAAMPALAGLAIYEAIQRRWGLLSLDSESAWTLVGAFIGADLCYYWWHRLSHVVNFLWAAHAVHHQSEDYNFSTALRQNPLTTLTSLPFYLPLAFLGVPVASFIAMKSLMILYQFWIHTRVIGRLGPLETVMNTPSHHRVHHGINPRYIDKNYAGTFIVWDRLFGTFEVESEPVVYGVLKPLRSWDPIWALLDPWISIWQSGAGGTALDRVRAFFKHPGWTPATPGDPDLAGAFASVRRHDPRLSRGAGLFVLIAFLLVLGSAAASLLLLFPKIEPPLRVSVSAMLVVAAWAVGRVNQALAR